MRSSRGDWGKAPTSSSKDPGVREKWIPVRGGGEKKSWALDH